MVKMKTFLIAVSSVFGSIPGLAILRSGLGTPPENAALFGGVIEAFGALSLALLWMNKDRLKKVTSYRITRVVISLAISTFVSIALYVLLFRLCVVVHESRGTAYYPLWLSGEIADMVNAAGSRWEAIEHYGIAAVILAIDKMSSTAITVTTLVLLFVYQNIFTCLTLAFGLLGFSDGAGEKKPLRKR